MLKNIRSILLLLSFVQIARTLPFDVADKPSITERFKRIVIGNQSLINPPKPLPIGNLSTPEGDAVCYFVSRHYYCVSQFLATHGQATRYCQGEKMKLLHFKEEEDHEYLYNFLSESFTSNARKFLNRSDFTSEEDYTEYVYENINPGLIVKCTAVCGNIRSTDEGRVLDYEDRDFVGLAVKVQWKSGIVRWYPAGNLEIRGYRSAAENRKKPSQTSGELTLDLSSIFEVGDKVRVRLDAPPDDASVWQGVAREEVGIVTDLEPSGEACLAHFPSNRNWRGLLDHLEIVDKRKASGTYWTSGKNNRQRGWLWTGINSPMTFTNWAPGEPSRAAGERCVAVKYHKRARWFAAKCSGRNNFICMK